MNSFEGYNLTSVVFEGIHFMENMVDEGVELLNRFLIDAVINGFAIDASLDDPGILQFS